ncbi:MAG: hypothetical protein ACREJC_00165 [Tepidisphaeraceae bacterium]
MLTLTGLRGVSDDFVDCLATYPGDIEFCQAMYPSTPDTPTMNDSLPVGYQAPNDQYNPPPSAGAQNVSVSPAPTAIPSTKISPMMIAAIAVVGLGGIYLYKRRSATKLKAA